MTKIKKSIIYIVITCIVVFAINLFVRTLYPLHYYDIIKHNAQKYDIDPLLIVSMVKVESRFDSEAISSKNAKGLMQIRDDTAIWCAKELGIDSFQTQYLFNPETNIILGTWYVDYLSEYYHGDITNMLSAYNAGMGNVNKWLKDSKYSTNGEDLDKIPYISTQNYINKVMNNYKIYKFLYKLEAYK